MDKKKKVFKPEGWTFTDDKKNLMADQKEDEYHTNGHYYNNPDGEFGAAKVGSGLESSFGGTHNESPKGSDTKGVPLLPIHDLHCRDCLPLYNFLRNSAWDRILCVHKASIFTSIPLAGRLASHYKCLTHGLRHANKKKNLRSMFRFLQLSVLRRRKPPGSRFRVRIDSSGASSVSMVEMLLSPEGKKELEKATLFAERNRRRTQRVLS